MRMRKQYLLNVFSSLLLESRTISFFVFRYLKTERARTESKVWKKIEANKSSSRHVTQRSHPVHLFIADREKMGVEDRIQESRYC